MWVSVHLYLIFSLNVRELSKHDIKTSNIYIVKSYILCLSIEIKGQSRVQKYSLSIV